jgi:hypothetical protein
MHRLRLERFSFRFAEQVLNARLSTKQELESVLLDASIDVPTLSRPVFNATLDRLFVDQGWDRQPPYSMIQVILPRKWTF